MCIVTDVAFEIDNHDINRKYVVTLSVNTGFKSN